MTTKYRIAEVARRSGFSRATLRYYEEIGLVPPPARTDAGYRIYGEEILNRLSFIARAKELGCSLEEITDLSALWAGDRCAPVREQLHALVTDKLAGAQRQAAEMVKLTADLQVAAARLGDSTPADERPCGEGCACAHALDAPPEAGKVSEDQIACTLDPSLMPGRMDEWQDVLLRVRARLPIPDGVRLEFDGERSAEELTRLAAAEQSCCEFFSFAVTMDRRGVGLEVRSGPEARAIVDDIFGVTS